MLVKKMHGTMLRDHIKVKLFYLVCAGFLISTGACSKPPTANSGQSLPVVESADAAVADFTAVGSETITSSQWGSISIYAGDTDTKAREMEALRNDPADSTVAAVKGHDNRVTKASGMVTAQPQYQSSTLPVPRNVRAVTMENNWILLLWDSAGSMLNYHVYHSTSDDPQQAQAIKQTADAYVIIEPTSEALGYFWVSSLKDELESAKSAAATGRRGTNNRTNLFLPPLEFNMLTPEQVYRYEAYLANPHPHEWADFTKFTANLPGYTGEKWFFESRDNFAKYFEWWIRASP
jgi:hypothetical protein